MGPPLLTPASAAGRRACTTADPCPPRTTTRRTTITTTPLPRSPTTTTPTPLTPRRWRQAAPPTTPHPRLALGPQPSLRGWRGGGPSPTPGAPSPSHHASAGGGPSQAPALRYFQLPPRAASAAMYVPARSGRGRKGPLVKQTKVEGEPQKGGGLPPAPSPASPASPQPPPAAAAPSEKNSIPIPTIIIKAPSTSSSGRSSQGSSTEAEPPAQPEAAAGSSAPSPAPAMSPVPPSPSPVPTPASPSGPATLDFTSQFGAALVGAARREGGWQNEARRRSTLFLSTDAGDEEGGDGVLGAGAPPGPRLRHSKSIDEGMFSAEPYLRLESAGAAGGGYGAYAAANRAYAGSGGSSAFTSFLPPRPLVHPLTGKALDPASPLGLALAARERALKESSEGGGTPPATSQAPIAPLRGPAAHPAPPLAARPPRAHAAPLGRLPAGPRPPGAGVPGGAGRPG